MRGHTRRIGERAMFSADCLHSMRLSDRVERLGARLPKTTAALAYARRLHQGQRRAADGAPFIEHPSEVGEPLYEVGATDEVIAAGLLHYAIEKTDATAYEVTARVGHRVGEIVRAVTDDDRIVEYSRRKAALRDQVANAGDDALAVFAADKPSKVREL
jgi:(p)ppGpp synthase/HD superfamily hydrolase